ncbi:hypothetical protein [Paraburkholderia sp.]|uniref:hypothetical protein n=1 Tax=Paraburkholderia sp. TaxID=1926495 RepID=UPI0039E61C27
MLTGPVTRRLGNQNSSRRAVPDASGDPRVVWFMSPRSSNWSGVSHQHGPTSVQALNRSAGFDAGMIAIPAQSRSLTGTDAADGKHTFAK